MRLGKVRRVLFFSFFPFFFLFNFGNSLLQRRGHCDGGEVREVGGGGGYLFKMLCCWES